MSTKMALACQRHGADIDAGNKKQQTLLMRAIPKLLIFAGANPSLRAWNGENALTQAIVHGHETVALMLIERGADLNVGNARDDRSALMLAALMGQLSVLELLIRSGADVHWRGKEGYTALHLACCSRKKSKQSIQRLIQAGADVNAASKEGITPLMSAVVEKNLPGIRLLLENHADPNRLYRGEHTVLDFPRAGITRYRPKEWKKVAKVLIQAGGKHYLNLVNERAQAFLDTRS